MNNKKSIRLAIVVVLVLVLTGCGTKMPMSTEKLNKVAMSNTEMLLKVRQLDEAKNQNKGKKTGSFKKEFNKKARAEEAKVKQSIDTLHSNKGFKGYSNNVYQYSRAVLDYVKAVDTDASVNTVKQKYHLVTKLAIKLAAESNNKKLNTYITTIVQYDSLLKKPQSNKAEEVRREKTKSIDKIVSSSKGKKINLTLAQGIVLMLLSVLLIISVFMQPNRSEDNTEALTNPTAKPKPQGFERLMQWSTRILLITIVAALIIFNRN